MRGEIMKYTTLGKTGLKVSVVGLGGIPVQRTDKAEAVEIVNACMEQGINYLDTARGYTVSEEYFGEAIKGNRDKWIIATKSMSRTYDAMKADIEISLKNLQTDYIDLYQIHNIKTDEEFDKMVKQSISKSYIEEINANNIYFDFFPGFQNVEYFKIFVIFAN